VRRPVLLSVVTAGVALAAAGCGGTASGSASPATNTSSATGTQSSSAAAATPTLDVCSVLPHDVLQSLGLPDKGTLDRDNGACEWQASGKDAISAKVEAYPLGQRPDPDNTRPTSTPLTIGAHKAMLLRSDTAGYCAVDLALASDITFDVGVLALSPQTFPAACDHVKALATGAEPKLPLS
jgi:hypothetical protein